MRRDQRRAQERIQKRRTEQTEKRKKTMFQSTLWHWN
jgi:hypothetical protein